MSAKFDVTDTLIRDGVTITNHRLRGRGRCEDVAVAVLVMAWEGGGRFTTRVVVVE